MTEPADNDQALESFKAFKDSFFYGSRSNLDFKFLAELSEPEAGEFFAGLLARLSTTMNDGDAMRIVDHAREWQQRAYTPHLDAKARFQYEDAPFTVLNKPLAQARIALVTSSGHFVDDDDPKPFGVENMSQAEAEARIGEFLRAEPTLSTIPIDTPPDRLRVRHGGYPTGAASLDHNVALPTKALRQLASSGIIGEVAPLAYSFVGATSQIRLRDSVAPLWAAMLQADAIDAVLLVPV